MASEYYIASNYRLNFVFMTDFIPRGQGWYIACPLVLQNSKSGIGVKGLSVNGG